MSDRVVLAVDGGNSKTDLALVREDGALLAHVRGPLSSPHHLGLDAVRRRSSSGSSDEALGIAGAERLAAVATAQVFLAGVDFPAEEDALRAALEARGWAERRRGRQRHARRAARRHRARAGASRSSAAPGSTASASRPTAVRCASRRSGSDHRRLGRRLRRRPRGALGRRAQRGRPRAAHEPRAGRAARTSGSTAPRALAEEIHAGRDLAAPA